MHLDVNRGLLEVWQQLAACLMHLNQRHNEQLREAEFGTFGQPQDFSGDNEETKKEECAQDAPYYVWKRRIWDERIPWWRNKHFHEKSVNLEQQVDGKWQSQINRPFCIVPLFFNGSITVRQILCLSKATAYTNFEVVLTIVDSNRLAFCHRNICKVTEI